MLLAPLSPPWIQVVPPWDTTVSPSLDETIADGTLPPLDADVSVMPSATGGSPAATRSPARPGRSTPRHDEPSGGSATPSPEELPAPQESPAPQAPPQAPPRERPAPDRQTEPLAPAHGGGNGGGTAANPCATFQDFRRQPCYDLLNRVGR
ncbi:hypothetical protein ACWEPC_13090 [Nonomuraea sp. NPDC004297]